MMRMPLAPKCSGDVGGGAFTSDSTGREQARAVILRVAKGQRVIDGQKECSSQRERFHYPHFFRLPHPHRKVLVGPTVEAETIRDLNNLSA